MRPIKLTVKGLHSFREKQTVDFDALCEGGVFGIFGPTGSGKSSLLDAMTLALYGKVERAPNNTQGILNHAEDTLAVSFTFQLGHGGRAKRYEVERTFKRSGEANIRSATCRFIDVTAVPEVLADKAGDVTKAVENLLGLSIDDFTRAVVLPQGKFSEFLSLKGSDRRQMLQRLFHLEKYGDELIAKLRSRLMNTKHEIELIEKEQAGLGNASKESLEEARVKVFQLTKDIEETRIAYSVLEKQLDEEKAVKKWMDEKDRLEKSLSHLAQEEERIKKLELKLKMALEAAVLLPYVKEVEESCNVVAALEKEVIETNHQLNQAKGALENAEEDWQQAKVARENEETPLRLKLDEYTRYLDELKSISVEEKALAELELTLEKLQSEIDALQRAKVKGEEELRRFEGAQRELKDNLRGLEVPIEEKRQVYAAMDEKRLIQQTESKIKDIQTEKLELLEVKSVFDQELAAEVKKVEDLKGNLIDVFKQLYQWYERVSDEERELVSFSKRLKEQKEELEKEKRHLLAKQLRQDLEEGEPCPVCGSTHHPLTEVRTEIDVHGNEDYQWIVSAMEQVTAEERKLMQLKWRLDEGTRKLNDVLTKEEIGCIAAKDVQSISLLTDSEMASKQVWMNFISKLSKEKLTIESLLNKVDTVFKNYQSVLEAIKEKNTSKKGYEERLEMLEKRLIEEQQVFKNAKGKWQLSFPGFSFEEMEKTLSRIQGKEEQATVCRERIEKSIPIIEGKEKEIASLQEKLQQSLLKQSSLGSELTQRQKSCSEKKQRIYEAVGNEDISSKIAEMNRRLELLLTQFKQGELHRNMAETAFKEVEQRFTRSQESLKHAKDRFKRAETNWTEQVKRTVFQDEEGVKHASLPDTEIEEMKATINEFTKERKQLEVELENCLKALGDRSVSDEQYEQTISGFREIKQKLEKLGTEKGGALATFKEIEQRVQRYEELESAKKQLKINLDKLLKLDHVFRGKAFVEYIAEEQLVQVSRLASERLHHLTRGRYAIEVDSTGGFIIRDDANGGVRRPVSTLSGGETFLTSLALALSLSASIQLKGEHPLEFFFLDEGFGTLDQELLEIVISALEKLHTDNLSVGVISHVPELRERLPKKLIVTRAEAGGKGSSVSIESM